MAGCGYVCPQCEGKEYLEDGTICSWCTLDHTIDKERESKDMLIRTNIKTDESN